MVRGKYGGLRDPGSELAAHLHDITAGLAVGIGLLKGAGCVADSGGSVGVEVLESVLADLKRLTQSAKHLPVRSRPTDLASELRQEATRLGVELDLELAGDAEWLTAQEHELVRLAAREAIRNVKRHSGATKCQVRLDLTDCPYSLRVRDWGGGIDPASQGGDGIERLRDLASSLGGELAVGSQPGLGTVLVLVGRRCPCSAKKARAAEPDNGLLRSLGAEESLSRRRRVATRRPIGSSGQQIS